MNEANFEQLMEVANIARRCLMVKGEDRPTMKEVAMELEGLRVHERHSRGWGEYDMSLEETEYLLKSTQHSHIVDVEDGLVGSYKTTDIDSTKQISMSLRGGR
ncbi:hypothetical protein L6164_023432 [Bauhinia variegata]|uniref:Uncharacterized protein n=1 Tax=Bauhinia variegata TaxID=167791 RepID=A0ACB9MIJ2_BAUVA|nr:hypothetical protein L6164_023432 [Bauhinia variegata]